MTRLIAPAGSRAARAAHTAAARLPGAGVVRAVRQVPGWVADGALAAGFLAAMLIEQAGQALPGARLPFTVALSVVIAGGLALRRRAPLASYLAGSSALVAEALWVSPGSAATYANLIGLYSLGLYATRVRAWWGLLIVPPLVFGYFSAAGSSAPSSTPARAVAGVLLVWLLAWAVGYGAARRREDQQAARQAIRRQAVAEERSRLARELHDLVGHTVNVMVVQAGAGRLVLDRDPAKTREILTSLEHTGRQALTELDRMLGLLRRDGPPAACRTGTEAAAGQPGPGGPLDEAGPTVPGIAELPRLARRMTETGIRVTVPAISSSSAEPMPSVVTAGVPSRRRPEPAKKAPSPGVASGSPGFRDRAGDPVLGASSWNVAAQTTSGPSRARASRGLSSLVRVGPFGPGLADLALEKVTSFNWPGRASKALAADVVRPFTARIG